MPFHADNPYHAQRSKEADVLTAYAMRRSPEEYFEFISRPRLSQLGEVAGLRTIAEYCEEGGIESEAIDLFEAGINNLTPALNAIVQAQPEISEAHASAIITSQNTYELLASINPRELLRIYEEYTPAFALSVDSTTLVLVEPTLAIPNLGNEAAEIGNNKTETSPLLKNFIPWAGSLAVLAYFEHR